MTHFKIQTSFLRIVERINNNFYLFDEFLAVSDSIQTRPAPMITLS
jgi:hypothetical protein